MQISKKSTSLTGVNTNVAVVVEECIDIIANSRWSER